MASEFWKLIGWHDLSRADTPQPSAVYDRRAADIYTVLRNNDRTPREDKLCWAAHRTLLRIIMEELHCTTELFSDLLNTFHVFEGRRSLDAHHSFRMASGVRRDGLDPTAYTGSVYANPPYDGMLGRGTIDRSIALAERRAAEGPGFRAVFLVPMKDDKLARFAGGQHNTVLMKFPRGTIPLIHPDYWRGTYTRDGGRKKWYDHPTAHMALLMVQSERLEGLAPVDRRSLERRLAEWHQSVMPPDKRTEEVYAGTGLSREAYRECGTSPTEWRLWEAGTRRVVGVDEPYPVTFGAREVARKPTNQLTKMQ